LRRDEILDKFEAIIETMSKLTEEERRKDIEENRASCICPDYPTYNECTQEKSELFYCGIDKSPICIVKEQGCLCPACLVTERMGLNYQFFCTKGTEKEQRGKK
jgi:hypothetical protein